MDCAPGIGMPGKREDCVLPDDVALDREDDDEHDEV